MMIQNLFGRGSFVFVSSYSLFGLLFSSILTLQAQVTSNLAQFKNITIEQGLTNNEVKQIFQDKEGFIWLATGSGIDRFDGYTFQRFSPKVDHAYDYDQLSWRPLKLSTDPDGHFFLGSDFSGLQVYAPTERKLSHYTTKNSNIRGDAVFDLICDTQGNIWVGTNQGLCRFNFSKKSFDPVGPAGKEVLAIVEDTNGNIWFSIGNEGIYVYLAKDRTVIPYSQTHQSDIYSQNLTIKDLSFDRSGHLLAASDQGIFLWDIFSDKCSKLFDLSTEGIQSFSSILQDGNGNFWAGTMEQGLIFFNPSEKKLIRFTHDLTNPHSIISNKIACLYEDREKNIWIGTFGEGVSVIAADFSKFNVYLPFGPTQGNDIKSFSRSEDGTIWMGLGSGIGYIPPLGGPPVFFQFPLTATCQGGINLICSFDKDHVLVETDCGIRLWSPKNPFHFENIIPSHSSIPQTNLLALYYLDDRLYVSTTLSNNKKGLWVYDFKDQSTRQFMSSEDVNTLAGNNVLRMLKSTDGRLWVGTWDELNILRPDHTFLRTDTLILDKTCLKGGNTTGAIWEDHLNNIWYSRIDDGGLLVLAPDLQKFNCFNTESGLPNNSITAIMQDLNQDIWVGSYLGVSKIHYPPDIFSKRDLQVITFSQKDGLPTNSLWNGISSLDGKRLYFGSSSGLIELFPEKIIVDTIPPILQFTDFKIFNKSILLSNLSDEIPDGDINRVKSMDLKYHQKVFSVEFAGLNFYDNERNTYAYRMKGIDQDWIEIGNQHIITYSNLPPSRYHLEVRVKSTKSHWSAPKSLFINISPPFWQRMWFFLTMSGLLLLLGYSIHRYRIQQILKIHTIRNKIASDLHDDIGTTLSNIEILSFLGDQNAQTPSMVKHFLQNILAEAKRSNEALHRIVWSINPENDQLSKVVAYMTRKALDVLETSGIEVTLQTEIIPDHLKLQAEKRKDLFLAFKEVITNICKYAAADRVNLRFTFSNGQLLITIKDNGVGLPEDAWEKGNGLTNIKTRLARWKGEASFLSKKNEGLEVLLIMPVP